MISDNKIIKASFRDCPLFERTLFKSSSCFMPISIGQKVHEGGKFVATLKLVNRNFTSCTILVDDTIQRYTLKISDPKRSLDDLYVDAYQLGSRWISNYSAIIKDELAIPHKIIRWDKWLKHKEFKPKLEFIRVKYNQDAGYRNLIDKNIFEFLTRYKNSTVCKELISFDWDMGFELCLKYLTEECAAMLLWVEENCEFELYPSGRNYAMAATYDKFIKPHYPHLLRSVALRFKKYNSTESLPSIANRQQNFSAYALVKNI